MQYIVSTVPIQPAVISLTKLTRGLMVLTCVWDMPVFNLS